MNRIRELRERDGMTQAELGAMLNVKDAAISKYESGKVPLTADTIIQLCKIFGVASDFLIGLSRDACKSSIPDNVGISIDDNFGSRLNGCISKSGDSMEDFSSKIGISKTELLSYISGVSMPSLSTLEKISSLLCISSDYLLGFTIESRRNKQGQEPFFRFDPEISRRLKDQAKQMDESYGLIADLLGIEENEVFNFFEYGFVPHISVFAKIVEHFLVSSDFLLNRTGSIMTVQPGEDRLLKAYRALSEDSQTIALSELLKLGREEALVAAKDQLLLGKSYPLNGTEG